MPHFVFSLPLEEILRYLGYQGELADSLLLQKLEQARQQIPKLAVPRWTYQVFPLEHASWGIVPTGTSLSLEGKDIAHHLQGCDHLILMAATLGPDAERWIKQLEFTDLTLCAMADAAATTAIEELCDWAENLLRLEWEAKGFFLTSRYSPGYGDFPIGIQKMFLDVLDAQRAIGLTVSPSGILLPRKSVTAVLGISSHPIKSSLCGGCRSCSNYSHCFYRKRGTFCDPGKAKP